VKKPVVRGGVAALAAVALAVPVAVGFAQTSGEEPSPAPPPELSDDSKRAAVETYELLKDYCEDQAGEGQEVPGDFCGERAEGLIGAQYAGESGEAP
jgi:hypothetical protein